MIEVRDMKDDKTGGGCAIMEGGIGHDKVLLMFICRPPFDSLHLVATIYGFK